MGKNTSQTMDLRAFGEGATSGVFVSRMVGHGNTPPHDHIFHEIVYVESGAAAHHTAVGRRDLRPGDVIVIRPQVWHAYERTRQMTSYNCLFEDRVLRRFWELLRPAGGAFQLFRRRTQNPQAEAPVGMNWCGPAWRRCDLKAGRPSICWSAWAIGRRSPGSQTASTPPRWGTDTTRTKHARCWLMGLADGLARGGRLRPLQGCAPIESPEEP